MKISEVIRIDSRGMVLIPANVRRDLGLVEGTFVMMLADTEEKDIKFIPFASPEAALAEFEITFTDTPGILAKTASLLAEREVDLLTTQSRTIKRGETTDWLAIADISKCNESLDSLKRLLEANEGTKDVTIKRYELPT